MNISELELALGWAEPRVLEIQAKLHRWAVADPGRRFDDLFNLVADPAFLLVAWARVRGNKGARTAGVDGHTALSITAAMGVEGFLDRLRASLKDRSFRPLPVRERMIPKAGGKKRRLGIATIADRVVQASLKLVLEPIFEADFLPCSYGFRPKRRTHDAVAEVRFLTSRSFRWVVEGDIKACFDEISHCALLESAGSRRGQARPGPGEGVLEVRLVNRVQHLADRTLEDLVLQGGDGRFILPSCNHVSGCSGSVRSCAGQPASAELAMRAWQAAPTFPGCLSVAGGAWCAGRRG